MPNKSKEIYTDVGYGHSPYYEGKAICFGFICADGVDQAKFRVRRALTYHFVVADADMNKLIARQKSMTCTKNAVADADMNKLTACKNRRHVPKAR